ncbi:MAG: cell surface protein, partial [Frankiales bacterium]|nr:cell surface protein [Frankiales bacterium]
MALTSDRLARPSRRAFRHVAQLAVLGLTASVLTVLSLISPQPAYALTSQLAYVVNNGAGTVSPVNISTGVVGSPITVGTNPTEVAITPDGSKAYVVNK